MRRKAHGSAGTSGGRRNRHAHDLLKTEICVFYMKGCCPRGNRCGFAHGNAELRTVPLEERSRRGLIPSVKRFKSDICEKWLTTGNCPYGDRCCFLHDSRVGLSLRELLETATIEVVRDAHPSVGTSKSVNRSRASSRSHSVDPPSGPNPDTEVSQNATNPTAIATLSPGVVALPETASSPVPTGRQGTLAAHKPAFGAYSEIGIDSLPYDVQSPTVLNASPHTSTPLSTSSNPTTLAASSSPAHISFSRMFNTRDATYGHGSARDYTQSPSPIRQLEPNTNHPPFNAPPLARRLSFSSGPLGANSLTPPVTRYEQDISHRMVVEQSDRTNETHVYPPLAVSNTAHSPYSVSDMSEMDYAIANYPSSMHSNTPTTTHVATSANTHPSPSYVSATTASPGSHLSPGYSELPRGLATPTRGSRRDASLSPVSTPGTPATPGTAYSVRSYRTTVSSKSAKKGMDQEDVSVAEAAIAVAVPQALSSVPKLHAARQLLALTTGIAMSSKQKGASNSTKAAGQSTASNAYSDVHPPRSTSHSPTPSPVLVGQSGAAVVTGSGDATSPVPHQDLQTRTAGSPQLHFTNNNTNGPKSGARILLNANGNLITDPKLGYDAANGAAWNTSDDNGSSADQTVVEDVTGLIAHESALVTTQRGADSTVGSVRMNQDGDEASTVPDANDGTKTKTGPDDNTVESPAAATDTTQAVPDKESVEDEWSPPAAECASKHLFPTTWETFLAAVAELETWRNNGCAVPSPNLSIHSTFFQEFDTKSTDEQRQWFRHQVQTSAFSKTSSHTSHICPKLLDVAFDRLQQIFFPSHSNAFPIHPSSIPLGSSLSSHSYLSASGAPGEPESAHDDAHAPAHESLTDTIIALLETYKSTNTKDDNVAPGTRTNLSGVSGSQKGLKSSGTKVDADPSPQSSNSTGCVASKDPDAPTSEKDNSCPCPLHKIDKSDPQYSRLPVLMLLSMGVDLTKTYERTVEPQTAVSKANVHSYIPSNNFPPSHVYAPSPVPGILPSATAPHASHWNVHRMAVTNAPSADPSQTPANDIPLSAHPLPNDNDVRVNVPQPKQWEYSRSHQNRERSPMTAVASYPYDALTTSGYRMQSLSETHLMYPAQGPDAAAGSRYAGRTSFMYPSDLSASTQYAYMYHHATEYTEERYSRVGQYAASTYAQNRQSGQNNSDVRHPSYKEYTNEGYTSQRNELAMKGSTYNKDIVSSNSHAHIYASSHLPQSEKLKGIEDSQDMWSIEARRARYHAEREIDTFKDSLFYPTFEHAMQHT